jgi:hypothetical protein
MRGEARATRSWWKGFHEYDVWSPCPLPNCTEAEVKAALSKMPALGTRVGDQTDIPGLGTVRHIEDSSGVLNITVEGQHLLSPGAVGRHVVTRDGVVGIQTYGVGWGVVPALNERAAKTFWQGVDSLVFNGAGAARGGR